nr:hypothetical protein GCM10017745_07480 [Saccharothrix mutabilis subsp. capreolus]
MGVAAVSGAAAVAGAAGAAVAGVVAPASSAAARAAVPTCRNTLVLVRGVRAAIGEVVMAITFADPPDTDRPPR